MVKIMNLDELSDEEAVQAIRHAMHVSEQQARQVLARQRGATEGDLMMIDEPSNSGTPVFEDVLYDPEFAPFVVMPSGVATGFQVTLDWAHSTQSTRVWNPQAEDLATA